MMAKSMILSDIYGSKQILYADSIPCKRKFCHRTIINHIKTHGISFHRSTKPHFTCSNAQTFALAFPTYTTHPVPCNNQPCYG